MAASGAQQSILVLGMHRSGTSAAAGALARRGVRLGDDLVPAAPDNPFGYFEHAAVVSIHERLLDALDRSWDDVRQLPDGWVDGKAAAEAAENLAAVLEGLDGAGPWALKDPRVSRLLPLWSASAALRQREVACLLMVRDPDEVAGSLAARDAMPPLQAHVLWLRYVFEAVRASEGVRRTVVAYSDLLLDPDGTLDAAAGRLGIVLPLGPAEAGLDRFVRPSARHHVLDGPRTHFTQWHALALDTYHALRAGTSPWGEVRAFESAFADLCRSHAEWIDALGSAARAADVRRRVLNGRALEMEQRADHLQARIDRTDAALADTSWVSMQRLEEAQRLQVQLDATQAALAAVEALSLQRLGELQVMSGQLARTDEALGRAEALSLQRLDELEATHRQLREMQDSLDCVEALSLQRLGELEDTARQMRETQEAQARAEALSLERLEQIEAAHRQLREMQDSLARVEALSLRRLEELEETARQLRETQAAQARAEALSTERLQALEAMQAQLDATQAALAGVEALSIRRLGEVEATHAQLRDTQDGLARIEAQSLARLHELQATRRQLDATDIALAEEATRSAGRLAAWESSVQRAEGLEADLRERTGERDAAVERIVALERELLRIRSTRTYRLRQRVLALLRRRETLGADP